MHGLPPQDARERMRELWQAERSNDPIRQTARELAARADYHRQMGSPQGIVRAYEEFVDQLQVACRIIRERDLDLEEAMALARPGTGRSLKEIAGNERIRLEAVPLREGASPIHALRASRLLAEGTSSDSSQRGAR